MTTTEKMVHYLGERTSRSRFLRRLSVLGLGATFGALVHPSVARATVPWRCCDLCEERSVTCNTGAAICSWCWTCCWYGDNPPHRYRCCEWSSSAICGNFCDQNVYCSTAEFLDNNCPLAPVP